MALSWLAGCSIPHLCGAKRPEKSRRGTFSGGKSSGLVDRIQSSVGEIIIASGMCSLAGGHGLEGQRVPCLPPNNAFDLRSSWEARFSNFSSHLASLA